MTSSLPDRLTTALEPSGHRRRAVTPGQAAAILALYVAVALAWRAARERERALLGRGVLDALEQLGDGVAVTADQRIVAATPAAVRLTGGGATAGADAVALAAPEEQPILRERARLRAGGIEPPQRLRTTVAGVELEVAAVPLALPGPELRVSVARQATRPNVQATREPGSTDRSLTMDRNPVTDLERVSADLDRLMAAASHDLREPLRAIKGFGELLEREAGPELSERNREFLAMIREASGRMEDLLDGLSELRRAGRAPRTTADVDLDEALEAVLQSRHEAIEARNAHVTHDHLPVVSADPAAIQTVLDQLIDNALKFNDGPEPHVHVEAAAHRDGWELTIVDDGIGVPDRERDRVFELFRRLHPRDAYPGSGVGLAVCRRIVQRHGGRIWIDDAPAGGSAVHVLIPDGGEETAR